MLRLCTLGGLRLDSGPQPLAGAATRRRPLALLALIAAAGQRGITRERLIGLLWPDRDEGAARHVLAQSLYALRKDLDADALLLNGGALRLNPAIITSDLQEFVGALDTGDQERAVALYQGPFLEGFYLSEVPEFERWVEDERFRLRSAYHSALEGVASHLERSGAWPRAAEFWNRRAADEPLASRPVIHLVRALVAAGDGAAAQRRLRAHLVVLESEGIPAGAELVALQHEIKATPALEARHPVGAHDPAPPRSTESPSDGVAADRRPVRRRAFLLALTFGILLVIALRTRAHARRAVPVVAVGLIESHLREDTAGLSRSLPDLITTQLAQVPGLAVISRGRLLEVLGSDIRLPGPGTLARGARAAGAGEIIEGAIYEEPGAFRLDLRRVQLNGGRVSGAVSVTGRQAADVVERAAAALAGTFGLKPPEVPLASLTSVSLVARRVYEEGLRSYYSGDRVTAAHLFEAALKDDSSFAMAAYYLALTKVGAVPDSEAAYWRRATRLAVGAADRERLLIQTDAAFRLDDARARELAETLSVRYPDDLDGKHLLGEQRLSAGDFPGAVTAFLSVVAADSAGRTGRAARCRACDAMHRAVWVNLMADSLDQAERLARELIRWNPGLAGSHGLLGTVLERRWRFSEAMDTYRRQHELSSESVSLRVVAMMIAQRRGDFAGLDSIAASFVGLARDPAELHFGLTWLAASARETGRPKESLRLARRARRLADSLNGGKTADAFALLPEALALLEMGRHDRQAARAAAAVFDTMARMATFPEPRMARHRVWMWTHQATSLALAGDTGLLPDLEHRIAEAARSSAYGRDRKMPAYVHGLLLEARGNLNGAADAFAESIWSPTENHVAPRLASVLVKSGRPASAIPVLQSWLRGPLDAANQYVARAWGHRALAEAFAATGQPDSAAWHRRWVQQAWSKAQPEYRSLSDGVGWR